MLKDTLIALYLICLVQFAHAQTYYQLTTASGTQNIGGKTVTITPTGVAFGPSGIHCGQFYYNLGNGTFTHGAYEFSFSSPVNKIRITTLALDGDPTDAQKDTLSILINGLPYTINISDIFIKASNCSPIPPNYITSDSPFVYNGKLISVLPVIKDKIIYIDIQPGPAINSVKLHSDRPVGIPFNIFFADTSVYINQPYYDTLYCPGDSLFLPYSIVPTFNSGNSFTAELSNAAGSFATPVSIGSLSSTTSGTIGAKIPQNTAAGSGYRVRIVSSNPARTSPDNGLDIHIKNGPSAVPVAGSNSPVCEGQTLNITSTNAGTGVGYSWAGPSFSSGIQNPSISNATPAHSGDYIVTAAIGTCMRRDTTTVTVKPLPAAPTANNNGPLCAGATLNLSANSSTGGAGYTWTGPVSVPTVQNPTITNVTASHNGVYNVTTTLNGCNSATAGSTTVVVNPIPAVPTAGSNSPVCTGGVLNLTANSSTAGVSYNWTGPNGFSSTQQNPVIDPVPTSAAGNYEVSASLNGCTSAKGSTTVVVNTISYLGAYASPNDTLCEGGTLTVVTVPTNGGSTPTFQWFKNNNPISGATNLTYPSTTYATGDTFYCRMIAGNICNTPITLFSNKIGITVLPKTPSPTVGISSNPAKPLPGNAVTFTATATNGGANPSYQWQRNGTDVTGATLSTWNTGNLNPYDRINVKLTSSDPCPETNPAYSDTIVVNFPTSVANNSTENIGLYPNPNDGNFTLKVATATNDVVVIEIVNAIGQTVYSAKLQPKNKHISHTLQLHKQLAAGVYLLKVQGEVLRFVVE